MSPEVRRLAECIPLLEPHAKRKIRAFIVEPDGGNHLDTKAFDAFWAVVYGAVRVDHDTALRIEHELLTCDKRISDLLAGWRPESLPRLGADA